MANRRVGYRKIICGLAWGRRNFRPARPESKQHVMGRKSLGEIMSTGYGERQALLGIPACAFRILLLVFYFFLSIYTPLTPTFFGWSPLHLLFSGHMVL